MPSGVGAGSVMWNKVETGTLWGNTCEGDSGRPRLSNPNMTISYYTEVINADTGSVFTCGSTVPSGTRITYRFVPHKPTHISWFITGAYHDSPYGEWVPKAARPSTGICTRDNFIKSARKHWGNLYAELVVDPPVETLTGIESLGCTGPVLGKYTCSTPTGGSFRPTFRFAATQGTFFMDHAEQYCHSRTTAPACSPASPYTSSFSGTYKENPYTLDIPAQTIACPIIVTKPVGTPPTTPTISASSVSCTVGTAHSITFSATDPDNDTIRYGIDWNNDNAIDQWVPPSGYVSSGTQQSAKRTFASAGTKTVNVLAQDQGGRNSAWANLSFRCAENPNLPGDATVGLNVDATGNLDDSFGGAGASTLPDLTLRVIPSLVRNGDTTQVNWSATNVTSCTVTASNGDSWDGLVSPVRGETSSSITRQTVYTLRCQSSQGIQTKTATVNVLPTWREQ